MGICSEAGRPRLICKSIIISLTFDRDMTMIKLTDSEIESVSFLAQRSDSEKSTEYLKRVSVLTRNIEENQFNLCPT